MCIIEKHFMIDYSIVELHFLLKLDNYSNQLFDKI